MPCSTHRRGSQPRPSRHSGGSDPWPADPRRKSPAPIRLIPPDSRGWRRRCGPADWPQLPNGSSGRSRQPRTEIKLRRTPLDHGVQPNVRFPGRGRQQIPHQIERRIRRSQGVCGTSAVFDEVSERPGILSRGGAVPRPDPVRNVAQQVFEQLQVLRAFPCDIMNRPPPASQKSFRRVFSAGSAFA